MEPALCIDEGIEDFVEVNTARGKLDNALQSQTTDSSSRSEFFMHNYSTLRDGDDSSQSFTRKTPVPKKRIRKDLDDNPLYQNTYMMKLFDRSVNLAKFPPNSPLYPICRAWLLNPGDGFEYDPLTMMPKVKLEEDVKPTIADIAIPTTPNAPDNTSEPEDRKPADTLDDITQLPPPFPEVDLTPVKPSRKKEPGILVNNDTDAASLLKHHKNRWVQIRKETIEKTRRYDSRYHQSHQILSNMYRTATSDD